MRSVFAACGACLSIALEAQVTWSRTYDGSALPEVVSSVGFEASDSSYRIISHGFDGMVQRQLFTAVDAHGDTMFTREYQSSDRFVQAGLSSSVREDGGGGILFCGTLYYANGANPDGMIWKFGSQGDSIWMRTYGDSSSEVLNSFVATDDGGFLLAGSKQVAETNVYAVRIDSTGAVLWEQAYGTSTNTENGFSVAQTPDSCYVICGFKWLSNSDVETWLIKINPLGAQLWAREYGGPFRDNGGAVSVLPDGSFIIGTARALAAWPDPAKNAALVKTDDQGIEQWTAVLSDSVRSFFSTPPIRLWDGSFVTAGGRIPGVIVGMLIKTDSVGNKLWQRTYSMTLAFSQTIYDLRRTLDGGFIMAGTAFDSLLVSQDAWLVKVDSFGCLVPGCQVFDGLEEQVTSLTGALALSPNPSRDRVEVRVAIPSSFKLSGPLLLTVVSSDGRIVLQDQLPSAATDRTLDVSSLVPGLYHLHLTDGHTWLAGAKLVKE